MSNGQNWLLTHMISVMSSCPTTARLQHTFTNFLPGCIFQTCWQGGAEQKSACSLKSVNIKPKVITNITGLGWEMNQDWKRREDHLMSTIWLLHLFPPWVRPGVHRCTKGLRSNCLWSYFFTFCLVLSVDREPLSDDLSMSSRWSCNTTH